MAKRFTDNEKWKKRFFRELPMEYKLLWIYILDDCNHAGVWDVDLEVAGLRIGYNHFDKDSLADIFNEQVVVIAEYKWFIPDFITFQYGKLNPSSRVHQSVIQILEKYNLYQPAKELEYIEIIDNKPKAVKFNAPTVEEVHEYCNERKNKVCADAFIDFYSSKGWLVGKNKMKDWKAAVRTWERNDFSKPKKNNKIAANLTTWNNVKNLLQ
jgi:hypothetical protein